MSIHDIPSDILEAVLKRGHSEEAIEKMPTKFLFREYCEWHGLINWGYRLYNLVVELQKAGEKTDAT